jgi:hypothetical protein
MNSPNRRIIPLNLPADLDHEVAGNPVISRLESSPANCFPGLDADIRNLDRRFFVGLVFDFLRCDDAAQSGVRLAAVNTADPDLTKEDKRGAFGKQLSGLQHLLETNVIIVLDSVTDNAGRTVSLLGQDGKPLDFIFAWRVIRSLGPGSLSIELSKLDAGTRVFLMKLTGCRRTYQTETGEFSTAYQPGELTQSLCSPWQHDFRDCACTYWASNHPDIVMAAHSANNDESEPAETAAAGGEESVVWLRAQRDGPGAPRTTGDATWGLEMDHYEVNQRWRELAFVLEGREQPAPWTAEPIGEAPPLAPSRMIPRLEELAGMEQALALEYLYARYTVRFYEQLDHAEDKASAAFIAHELLNVAVSEMIHLRWVNELLRELRQLDGQGHHEPELRAARKVPKGFSDPAEEQDPDYDMTKRDAVERPIDEAIADFVAAEAPSGTIEGQYAQIRSRLIIGWPKDGEVRPDLIGLVERIIADGVDHYAHFREIHALLQRPDKNALVKHLDNLERADDAFQKAEEFYAQIIRHLRDALILSGEVSARAAGEARKVMIKLDEFAQELAQTRGRAIPFLTIAWDYAWRPRELGQPA